MALITRAELAAYGGFHAGDGTITYASRTTIKYDCTFVISRTISTIIHRLELRLHHQCFSLSSLCGGLV